MKKLFSIVAIFAVSNTFLFAQTNKEEVDFYQSILGAEKKAMVAEFLQLDQDNAFWAIYDEYESQRKALGQARLDLLQDYVENYMTLTDAKTDELVKQSVKLNKTNEKLIVKYHKKVQKSSGSRIAAQFYQIENYVLSSVRLGLLDNIPAIGEFN